MRAKPTNQTIKDRQRLIPLTSGARQVARYGEAGGDASALRRHQKKGVQYVEPGGNCVWLCDVRHEDDGGIPTLQK